MWVNILGIVAVFSAAVGLATKYLGLDVDSPLWVIVPLAAAAILGLVWLVFNAKNIVRLATSRSARYGVNLFALSLIVGFIIVMVNVVITGKRIQWDTTQNRRFSLAPQSLQVVSALDGDVMVTAISRGDLATDSDLFATLFARQMDLYRSASGRVNYRVVSARRNPEAVRDLPNPMEGNIYVTMGDRTVQVESYREITDLEEKITRAIIAVTREEQKGAYIVTRRGEDIFTPNEQTGFSFSELRRGLESEQFTVHTLNLTESPEVPDDCQVLIIADPEYSFGDTDLAALASHINRGGQVFACIDVEPLLDGLADTALVDFFGQFGIQVGKDVVVERSAALSFTQGLVDQVSFNFDAVNLSESSDITKDLINPVSFYLARSVSAAPTLPPGVDAELLISASRNSWAEADLDRFRQGQVTPGNDPIATAAPVAQLFTVDVNEHPAVFTPATMPGAMPLGTVTIVSSPEDAAVPPAPEPMPVSDTPPDMGLSMDEIPEPGGAVDEGHDHSEDDGHDHGEDAVAAAAASPEDAAGETATVPPARLLVIGDATVLYDPLMIPGRGGNRDFVLNAMNYLAADTDLIAIRPRDSLNTGFELSALQARLLLVILIAMPVLTAMSGVIVAVRRRRLA